MHNNKKIRIVKGDDMAIKVKSIKRGFWLINYSVINKRLIFLDSAFKLLHKKGWWEGGNHHVPFLSRR
jgi:hypothetical protein